MRATTAALFTALFPSALLADDLPVLDGSDDCQAMADFYDDAAILDECLTVEADSLGILQTNWSSVPGDVQARCSVVVASEMPAVGMYQTLALCVARTMNESGRVLPFDLPPHLEELRS